MYSLMYNKDSSDAHAVMAWDDGRLLGWAILVPHDKETGWYSTRYQKKKSKFVAQFYVRKTHRNQGIGKRLMRHVNKLDATPTVIPHDDRSAHFFASHDVVTEACRRGMLTSAKKKKRAAA